MTTRSVDFPDGYTNDSAPTVSGASWGEIDGTLADQTDLQSALNAKADASALTAHLNDTSDAHDASAISSVPSGNLAATEVQAALNELQTDIDTRATSSALTFGLAGKQDLDSDLTAVAGLSSTGLIARTGAGTAAVRTVTGTANQITATNGDGVAGNPTLSLPSTGLVLPGTAAVQVPAGTTAQRPSGVNSMFRYNSDTGNFEGYAAGAWGSIAGSGGGINYISASDGATIGAWAAYADAAGVSPVDGTGGSPSSTFAVSSDSSMVGASNFIWTKSAANRQGEGFSYDFSIDQAYQSKPLTISFLYKVASGTFTDDAMSVWIYDVTNSTLIQPTPYLIKNSTTAESMKCEFQAASNSTSYRLIFHTAGTDTVAYTMRFDSFSVAPNTYSSGASVGDWKLFTPTGTWSSNTTYTGFYRRVADSIEVQVSIALSGAPTAATLAVNLPSGLTIDTTKLANSSGFRSVIGEGYVRDDSAGSNLASVVTYNDSTSVWIALASGTSGLGGNLNPITNTAPFTFASSDVISFSYKVPIAGYGSSQTLSSETDTRVVTARLSGNAASASSGNPIIFPTVDFDTHGAYNSTTGRYTAVIGGFYRIGGVLSAAQTSVKVSAYVDASLVCPLGVTDSNGNGNLSGIVKVNAGQVIDVRPGATLDEDANATLTIERISGPAQIAASEKVYLYYRDSSSNALTANVTNATYLTKVTDSHGCWSGTLFTAPRAGVYRFTGAMAMTAASTNYVQLYINGSVAQTSSLDSNNSIKPFAYEYYMQSGDTASVRSTASVTLNTNVTNHWIAISSQG